MKIRTINHAIKDAGLRMELIKGRGYFYFIGPDVNPHAEGVYVFTLNQLSVSQWVQEARERRGGASAS